MSPEYHGWTHAPKSAGGTDPIPGGANPIEAIRGTASTNLIAAPTQVEYSESTSAHSGTYFQFNVDGNLEILLPGVYNLSWTSRNWSLTGNKVCVVEIDVTIVSGSDGSWVTGPLTTGGTFAILPLLLPDIIDGVDTTPAWSQDVNVIALWDSLDTFPVEINTTYQYVEDGSPTAQTLATFAVGCVRLGDVYE